MRANTRARSTEAGHERPTQTNRDQTGPEENPTELEGSDEFSESNDLDEADLADPDDERWDIFILDDDDDPLPDYGDFWMPD